MESSTVVRVQEIIEPVLTSLSLELVEVQLRNEQIGLVLRIIIYKEEGISVDDCTLVSKEVGQLLEIEDVISKAYHLEVSSPGLDRPLTTERDFTRNIGKKVKLTISEADKTEIVRGVVEKCQDAVLSLNTGGSVSTIALGKIAKAKLVIEF